MRASWTTWLAISLWTISIIFALCYFVLIYANYEPVDGFLGEGGALYGLVVLGSLGTVGAILATHRPGNPIGWIFLVAAFSSGVGGIAVGYSTYIAETSPGTLPEFSLLLWLGGWVWILLFWLPQTFGILLFPTGRLPSRRWRPFAWVGAVWLALEIVYEMLKPGPLEPEGPLSEFTNPIGIDPMPGIVDGFMALIDIVGPLLVVGALISVFARMRRAGGLERQQIKWFAYAAIVPLAAIIVFVMLIALTDIGESASDEVAGYITLMGIVLLTVATGIAILRHNLYDIDRLINRTLVYGSLTALLILGFVGGVVLFQFILSPFTSGNDLAVAGSTLLVAALFRPVRNRLQQFVDRRFYRRKYDARQTLEAFSVTARDATHIEQLTVEVTEVVTRTVQPKHISIWLQPAQQAQAKKV